MAKAYIIIQGSGSYSDRVTEPVRVYLDSGKAQQMMAKLDAVYAKCDHEVGGYIINEKIRPQIKAEYAAIGFDADPYDDWELAEAELEE